MERKVIWGRGWWRLGVSGFQKDPLMKNWMVGGEFVCICEHVLTHLHRLTKMSICRAYPPSVAFPSICFAPFPIWQSHYQKKMLSPISHNNPQTPPATREPGARHIIVSVGYSSQCERSERLSANGQVVKKEEEEGRGKASQEFTLDVLENETTKQVQDGNKEREAWHWGRGRDNASRALYYNTLVCCKYS